MAGATLAQQPLALGQTPSPGFGVMADGGEGAQHHGPGIGQPGVAVDGHGLFGEIDGGDAVPFQVRDLGEEHQVQGAVADRPQVRRQLQAALKLVARFGEVRGLEQHLGQATAARHHLGAAVAAVSGGGGGGTAVLEGARGVVQVEAHVAAQGQVGGGHRCEPVTAAEPDAVVVVPFRGTHAALQQVGVAEAAQRPRLVLGRGGIARVAAGQPVLFQAAFDVAAGKEDVSAMVMDAREIAGETVAFGHRLCRFEDGEGFGGAVDDAHACHQVEAERDFLLWPAVRFAKRVERIGEMPDCFGVGPAGLRQFSRPLPVVESRRGLAGLAEMAGQDLGLRERRLGEVPLQDLGDAAVVALARAQEQRLVGRLLDQAVPELDHGVGRHALDVDQSGAGQGRQRGFRVRAGHRRQHALIEGAADDRG